MARVLRAGGRAGGLADYREFLFFVCFFIYIYIYVLSVCFISEFLETPCDVVLSLVISKLMFAILG